LYLHNNSIINNSIYSFNYIVNTCWYIIQFYWKYFCILKLLEYIVFMVFFLIDEYNFVFSHSLTNFNFYTYPFTYNLYEINIFISFFVFIFILYFLYYYLKYSCTVLSILTYTQNLFNTGKTLFNCYLY